MAIMSSRLMRHEMCKNQLKKMGAKVYDIQGMMFYVKFVIGSNKIYYMYHLNPDNTFRLERIKPYTMPIGEFATEEDVVDLIKIDIEQFKQAMKSSNFNTFVELDHNIANLVRVFEDLYLYYNIPKVDLKLINEEVDTLLGSILETKNHSERVYFKKEPESF